MIDEIFEDLKNSSCDEMDRVNEELPEVSAISSVISKMIHKILDDNRIADEKVAEKILAVALENEFDDYNFWEHNVYIVMDEILDEIGR